MRLVERKNVIQSCRCKFYKRCTMCLQKMYNALLESKYFKIIYENEKVYVKKYNYLWVKVQ